MWLSFGVRWLSVCSSIGYVLADPVCRLSMNVISYDALLVVFCWLDLVLLLCYLSTCVVQLPDWVVMMFMYSIGFSRWGVVRCCFVMVVSEGCVNVDPFQARGSVNQR